MRGRRSQRPASGSAGPGGRERPVAVSGPARRTRTTRGRSSRRSTRRSSAPGSWPGRSRPGSCCVRDALAHVLDAADRALGAREHAAAATLIHERPLQVGLRADLGVDVRVRGVPLAMPFLVARQRRRRADAGADPRLNVLRDPLARSLGVATARRRDRRSTSPPSDPASDWPWALTPLLGRAVAAWYALFGTMLRELRDRPAAPGRGAHPLRHARAAGACCCSRCRCCTRTTSAAPGVWVALMVALLALSAYALKLALPARDTALSRCRRPRGGRASA